MPLKEEREDAQAFTGTNELTKEARSRKEEEEEEEEELCLSVCVRPESLPQSFAVDVRGRRTGIGVVARGNALVALDDLSNGMLLQVRM